jgi:class II lanthipeptide synthase
VSRGAAPVVGAEPCGDVRWYERAAFLAERRPDRGLDRETGDPDVDALERRWTRNCAAGDQPRFERRLDSLGLDRSDLAALMVAPRWSDPPAWVDIAEQAASRACAGVDAIDWDLDGRVPFGSLLQPWVDGAVDRLSGLVEFDVERLRPSLERGMRMRLRRCGEPAILDLFRRSGCGYRSWIVEQRRSGFADLFDTVPVWGRLAAGGAASWVDAMAIFFRDLGADEDAVRTELLHGDDSAVIELELSGDPHNGGRQVVIVTTAAGRRVVYKPRSVAAESTVAMAGRHLQDHGGLDFDPVAPVIDRGRHGWMGWIESSPPTGAEMTAYSRRAGALLAVARAMAITDLHDENLLPAGDRPVLVDLECLATARPNDRVHPDPDGPAQSLLDRSIIDSDLLVNSRRFAREGRDMSGLTGFQVTGAVDEAPHYVWSGLGTDAITLDRTRTRRQCDEPALMLDIDAVLEGLAHTEERIARHGLGIDWSRSVTTRVLVQDTTFYSGLLDRSLTVGALSDGLWYSIEMEQVAAAATLDEATSWRLAAASRERELLEAHDIPLFVIDWNDTSGFLGSREIPELVDEPGTKTIAARREDGTPDRRRLQGELALMLLGMRLELARRRAGQEAPESTVAPRTSVTAAEPCSVTDRCREIAEHLERHAVRDDFGGLCWLDVDNPGQVLAPMLTDDGLCGGNAGVAIFLAALARETDEIRWADLARRSLAGEPPMRDTSLYLGRSGRGYALSVVGALLDDRELADRGTGLLRSLPGPADADAKPLDVLFGLPGIAGALGAVATMTGDESLAAQATDYARLGEREWRNAATGGRRGRIEAHRIGVAHGITGLALCMTRVFEATEDPQLLAWIEEMVATENDRVDRRGGLPARLDAVNREPDRGWCWGAAGYVMAREIIAEATGIAAALHAVDIGRRVAAEGDGRIDRLCCGRAAQADVLGAESVHLAALLDRPLRWEFEKDSAHQNAGLLRGVAGVGLTLLRAAAPGRVPQPLTLDPVYAV